MIVRLLKFLKGLKDRLMYKYYAYRVKLIAKSIGKNFKVRKFSIVNSQTEIGRNVYLNGVRVYGSGEVKIGNNCRFAEGCLLMAGHHDFEGDSLPYDNSRIIPKKIVIKDNAWLGARAIVTGGNTIGEGAIIQAGSVVISDIPKCAIAGGNPAKVFKYRDRKHYEKLKKDEKFHIAEY
jgi:acetyltransferase-like isoleucine patch superfamily enzyme